MHTKPDLWVLTCAPASRTAEAEDLFDSLVPATALHVLVTTEPDPVTNISGHLLRYPGSDINISKWWTMGLDFIASHYGPDDQWDVLLIETDARISPDGVDSLRDHMRFLDTVMAGADTMDVLGNRSYHVRRDNDSWDPRGRMPGFAVVVSGEAGIRHDPEFRWWLADDDFEWQHRVGGGTVLVSGIDLHHVGTQGTLDPERADAFEEDKDKFLAKWGGMPVLGGVLPSPVVRSITHEPSRRTVR